MNEWLKDLKVGDKVIVNGNWHTAIGTVEKLTATQIVLRGGHTRYRRKDGGACGAFDSYHRNYLEQATEERLNLIRHKQLAHKLSVVRWQDFPLETLGKVLALIQTEVKE